MNRIKIQARFVFGALAAVFFVFCSVGCKEVIGGEMVLPNSAKTIANAVANADSVETLKTFKVYAANGSANLKNSEINLNLKKEAKKIVSNFKDSVKVTKTVKDSVKVTKSVKDSIKITKTVFDTIKAGSTYNGVRLDRDTAIPRQIMTDSVFFKSISVDSFFFKVAQVDSFFFKVGVVDSVISLGWINGGSGILLGDSCIIRPSNYTGAQRLTLKDGVNGDQVLFVTGKLPLEAFTNTATPNATTPVTSLEVGEELPCGADFWNAVGQTSDQWTPIHRFQRLQLRHAKRIKIWDGTGLASPLPVVSWPATATSANAYNWSFAFQTSQGFFASHIDWGTKNTLSVWNATGFNQLNGKIQFAPSAASTVYTLGSGITVTAGGCNVKL